ncbi:MAG: trypsin-like peptidase domain-containing protein [Myxococcales bacterium]
MTKRRSTSSKTIRIALVAGLASLAAGVRLGAGLSGSGKIGTIGTIGTIGMMGSAVANASTPTPPLAPVPGPGGTPITPKTEMPDAARALSTAFASAAKALRPSVVRIDVESGPPAVANNRRGRPDRPNSPHNPNNPNNPNMRPDVPDIFKHFFDMEPGEGGPGAGMPRRGTGSGVVIDNAGDVVTNRHVVEGASKVTVTLWDGTEVSAKVVGADERTDVAVVRLEKVPKGLVVARLGDSEHVDVGEWVLAIGSPLGLEQTVTAGIISGKGRAGRRVHMSGDRVRSYIQTDAKINPGNSGGPLATLNGEVVGINTLINAGPGGAYGFAIPINEVRRVSQVLLKDGRVRYPYLGVMVGDLSDLEPAKKATLGQNLPPRAAFVSEVSPGGPAARAGVQAGDTITQIDGRKIEYGADVVDYVSSRNIGSKVNITYLRGGKNASTTVVLGELPGSDDAQVAQTGATGKLGLGLQTLTPEIAGSLGLPNNVKGAVITDVVPASPAERAGVKEGDVIVEIDRKPVSSADEAVAALRTPRNGGHLIRVRGPSGARFITIPSAGQ